MNVKIFSTRNLSTWILCALLLSTSALPARAAAVRELQLAPGVGAVDLRFTGWLGNPGDQYQILAAPSFGSLTGETYSPFPEFWLAGGDTFQVRVTDGGTGNAEDLTVLLTAARPEETLVINDFEAGEVPPPLGPEIAGWHQLGDPSLISLVPGLGGSANAVRIEIEDGTPATLRHNPGVLNDGENSVGALGDVDLTPPVNDPPGSIVFVGGSDGVAGDGGRIRLVASNLFQDHWALRAEVLDCHPGSPTCVSPWVPVTPGEASFDVWAGPQVFGHPVEAPNSLRLSITQGGSTTTHWLEGVGADTSQVIDFGVVDSTGMDGGWVDLDAIAYLFGSTRAAPRAHLAEDFESGSVGPSWLPEGPMTVAPPTGKQSRRLEIDLLATAAQQGSSHLVDTSPDAETAVTSRFSLDLTDLGFESGDSVLIWSASSTNNPDAGRHVSLKLRRFGSTYQLRARARDDHDTLHTTPWAAVPAGPVTVTLAWTSGDGDGSLRLFLGGVLGGECTGLVNGSKQIGSVRYGAYEVVTTGLGFSEMILRFDDLLAFN